MVLPREKNSPITELVSAGGDTIALRVPRHPLAQHLLRRFAGGIAAPSANRSGRVSPTAAKHVQAELGATIPLILDGGPCEVGLESTVVDLSGALPLLLRPGSITRAMLEEVLGQPLGIAPTGGILHAPGQLASHYAPSIPVRLNAHDVRPDEALLTFGAAVLTGAALTLNLSEHSDLVEAAANLFAYLRRLDDARYRAIAVMPIPNTGIGEAINDRLKRAAA